MKTPDSQSKPSPRPVWGWSIAALALAGVPVGAQVSDAPPNSGGADAVAEAPSRVRIEAVAGRLVPGKTNFIGLVFRIEKPWHIYWDGLNDTGAAPEFTVSLPEGWTQGKTRWPAPTRHVMPGDIVDYIYEDEVTLLVPIDIDASAAGTEAELVFNVRWLVCSDVCIPEKGIAALRARVAKSDAPLAEPPRAPRQIAETLYRRLPRPMKEAEGIKVAVERGTLRIEAPGATRICFMPAADSVGLEDAAGEGEVKGSMLKAELAIPEGNHTTVVGVVQLERGRGVESYWFDESDASAPNETVPKTGTEVKQQLQEREERPSE